MERTEWVNKRNFSAKQKAAWLHELTTKFPAVKRRSNDSKQFQLQNFCVRAFKAAGLVVCRISQQAVRERC